MYRIQAAILPQMDEVRSLFREYAASLEVDLCFQNFTRELAELPGTYSPILLASCETDVNLAGCAALRPLSETVGEMKRLYVRPHHRGHGLGRRLAGEIIEEAIRQGFHSLRLDTLPQMQEAIAMYRRFGFREIGPYCANPVPGALFLELPLHCYARRYDDR
jgi:putative acetyltransferase